MNKVGFVWLGVDYKWEERLQQLVDFNDEFNHTNVPQKYTKNRPLATCVRTQRNQYKYIEDGKPSSLTKERIESLNKIGFIWRPKVGVHTHI